MKIEVVIVVIVFVLPFEKKKMYENVSVIIFHLLRFRTQNICSIFNSKNVIIKQPLNSRIFIYPTYIYLAIPTGNRHFLYTDNGIYTSLD